MKIIAIGAHPDDIELGCGGALSRAIREGHTVKCISMTQSGYSRYDGTVLRTNQEAEAEGRAGLAALGVTDYVVFDFPVKHVPYNGETVEAIDGVLAEFQPNILFTHWSFDTHQDHHHTSLASISAARHFPSILMYEPFPPSGRSYHPFRPQMYIDITQDMTAKIAALKAHASQFKKYGQDWLESTEGRARMRGNESGVKYAESFEIVRYRLDF